MMLWFPIIPNPKSRIVLGKTRTGFGIIDPQLHRFGLSVESSKEYVKKSRGSSTVCRFSKAFNSVLRGKMEQIQIAYGFPQETVTLLIKFYQNTKKVVHLPDGSTYFFAIVTGDLLAPYLFIIYQVNVIRTSIDLIKDNSLTLKRPETLRDTDQSRGSKRYWPLQERN